MNRKGFISLLGVVIVLLILGIVSVYLTQSQGKNVSLDRNLKTSQDLSYRDLYNDDSPSKTNSQKKIYQGITDLRQDMSDYEKRLESLE